MYAVTRVLTTTPWKVKLSCSIPHTSPFPGCSNHSHAPSSTPTASQGTANGTTDLPALEEHITHFRGEILKGRKCRDGRRVRGRVCFRVRSRKRGDRGQSNDKQCGGLHTVGRYREC